MDLIVNVIHDALRTDRHHLFLMEAAQQGFNFRVWDAVKSGKPKENISLAHKQIIRFAKENNLPEVCVMENDCHFTSPTSFNFFISKKPTDYDLYLSSVEYGRINGDNTIQDFAGFQLYFCHEKFYDTFLEADPTKDIDRMMARKGKFIVCQPFATVQHETISDNSRRKIHSNAKLYFNRTLYNGTNGQ